MVEKEYIERDGVMQKFADRVWLSNHSDFSTTPTWNQAVQIVEDFPAADMRPVVLCRDCKFRSNEWTGCPKLYGMITYDEFFCAAGIKREES